MGIVTMNAITPVAAGASMALLPQNLTEAMKLAELMSKAKLLPVAVQNPADAFMIVNQALRWGMDPFAVAQEVAVIQGRMMYSGKIVAAALHTSGVLDGRLSYEYAGENGSMSVTATGLLRGEKEPRSVTVALKDAKTANQHWAKSPQQMLGYHAARVWARRHAPEVMLGVYAPEEFEPDPKPEPRPVQSVQSRPMTHRAEPAPPALEPTSLRDMRPVPSRAEIDKSLDNDQIPALQPDEPSGRDPEPEPEPDRARQGVKALEARIRAAATEDELHAITGDAKVAKQRA